MNLVAIRAAMESRLNAWAATQAPAWPIAWENVPFDPNSSPYLRAFVMPATTVSGSFCDAEEKGVFQVNVYAAQDVGTAAAARAAGDVAALFPAGLVLVNDELQLKFPTWPSIGGGLVSDEFYLLPVSIRYRV